MLAPRLASLALIAALAALFSAGPTRAEPAAEGSGPILVKIHADWCGTCRKLNPTWDELKARHGDSLSYVIFDVTSRDTLVQSTAAAERLGILPVLNRYKARTGTIVIVDGRTKQVVEVLKGQTDPAAYEAAIERAQADESS
jgi:thiol-disulfide isomerase/thioredoxin